DGDDRRGHDLAHLPGMRVHILLRLPTGSGEKFQPAWTVLLRVDLSAPQQIPRRNGAANRPAGVGHRHTPDPNVRHHARVRVDGGVRGDGNDVARHDLSHIHRIHSDSSEPYSQEKTESPLILINALACRQYQPRVEIPDLWDRERFAHSDRHGYPPTAGA